MTTHPASACTHCRLWFGRPGRNELPATWRPLRTHPRMAVGAWVRDSVQFCAECGRLWYVVFDPKDLYYSTIAPIGPEYTAVLAAHDRLEDVWPLAFPEHGVEQQLVADYFAHGEYDAQLAAAHLADLLGDSNLTLSRAARVLGLLAAVLGNPGFAERSRRTGRPVARLEDAGLLAGILGREDLFAGDPEGRNRLLELLEVLVERAFSTVRGRPDRLAVDRESRERLVRLAGLPARRDRAVVKMAGMVDRLQEARDPTAPFPFDLLSDLSWTAEGLHRLIGDSDVPLTPEAETVVGRGIAVCRELARSTIPENASPAALGAARSLGYLQERAEIRKRVEERQRRGRAEREREEASRNLPETRASRLWRVALLTVLGGLTVFLDGIFFGLFTVPEATSFFAYVNVPILFAAVSVTLALARPHSARRAWCYGLAVAAGTIFWGHQVAYRWDAETWARRYWAQRVGTVSAESADGEDLLTRFIRDVLEEPAAGGVWDMLRVRARIGAELPVKEAFQAGRTRDRRVPGGEMWFKWNIDALLALVAAGAAVRSGRETWIASDDSAAGEPTPLADRNRMELER